MWSTTRNKKEINVEKTKEQIYVEQTRYSNEVKKNKTERNEMDRGIKIRIDLNEKKSIW